MKSSGGYYDDRNPLLKGTLTSVERDYQRERQRQARAAMSENGRGDSRFTHTLNPEPIHNTDSLFQAPVRVNPSPQDRITQQIQSKLGNYSLVIPLLEEPKRLIGIEGVPPSPAPPSQNHGSLSSCNSSSSSRSSSMSNAPQSQSRSSIMTGSTSQSSTSRSSTMRNSSNSSAAPQQGTQNQEFKKPSGVRPSASSSSSGNLTSHSSSSQQQQRHHNFVKPADGKPTYHSRSGYSQHPNKQHSGSSSGNSSGSHDVRRQSSHSSSNSSSSNNSNSHEARSHEIRGPSHGSSSSKLPQARTSSTGSSNAQNLPTSSSQNRTHQQPSVRIPKLPIATSDSSSKIDLILREMTKLPSTPLKQIAQTPRIDLDAKFHFSQDLPKLSDDEKVDDINAPPPSAFDLERPVSNQLSTASLEHDLSLSEDSDEEDNSTQKPGAVRKTTDYDTESNRAVSASKLSMILADTVMPSPLAPMLMTPFHSNNAMPTLPATPTMQSSQEPLSLLLPPPIPVIAQPSPLVQDDQRPPSPQGEDPESSDSSESSSDSSSDSCSDCSDDSEDEAHDTSSSVAPNLTASKGPTTPPSVSPPREEPPVPAVEESKPRWNLGSFFTKAKVEITDKKQEVKPEQPVQTQQTPAKQVPERRQSKQSRDWNIEEPQTKRRAATAAVAQMTQSGTSADEQHSDADKVVMKAKVNVDKPKTDVKKRGRPRKSPIAASVPPPETETHSKSASAKRKRQQSSPPRRRPSKRPSTTSTTPTSAASKSTILQLSSDTDSDSEPIQTSRSKKHKKTYLSGSSSEDDEECIKKMPPPTKGHGKSSDSSKKSSLKARRQRTRVVSAPKCPTDSDSEDEDQNTTRNIRKVARVQPRPRLPLTNFTSPENSDSDNSPPSIKLQESLDGTHINKKSALRRLFVETRAKGTNNGKSAKGGKGGKCGIYIEEYTPAANSENSCKKQATTPSSNVDIETDQEKIEVPALTYVNGVPRLLCRIDLSRITRVPQPVTGEPIRKINEMADPRSFHCRPKDDTVTDVLQKYTPNTAEDSDSAHLNQPKDSAKHHYHEEEKPKLPKTSEKKRKRKDSCSSKSSMSTVCSTDSKKRSKSKERKHKKNKDQETLNVQYCDTLPTNHEREEKLDVKYLMNQGEPPKRLFYSNFYRHNENTEDLERYQDQYLAEAKRLKHLADIEKDVTTQGALYLQCGMYFLMTGQSMESTTDRAAFRMYRDTLSIIRFIANKYGMEQTDDSIERAIHVKIMILSLWCQSIICQKLFSMSRTEMKINYSSITDYFQKQPLPQHDVGQGTPPAPILTPTPSPAGSVNSVASQSSGYSSGELANKAPGNAVTPGNGYVNVPVGVMAMLQKQNSDMGMLINSYEKWERACALVKDNNRAFFIELDETCGPLTLKSSLTDLARYVLEAIKKLRTL